MVVSLNVLKTHYMIFTSRNKCVSDVDIRINNVQIERVYSTKFLGVQIDAQLTWKRHIEYTCKQLSKCVGILAKARKKLDKSSLLTLYYSFAFPYFIYCNHVWGNTYQTNLKSIVLVQKKTGMNNKLCTIQSTHRASYVCQQNTIGKWHQ